MNNKIKTICLSLAAAFCVSLACMSFVNLKQSPAQTAPKSSKAKTAPKPATPDQAAITKYLKDHKLKAKKTKSGLYYVINKQGTGDKVTSGKQYSVNYTGKLLDGSEFDSNTDPKFKHVQPFTLTVGVGMVIKGWDEGLQLFNVGGKGILLIPAVLAYGPNGRPGIPANSVLVFDVEIVSQVQ